MGGAPLYPSPPHRRIGPGATLITENDPRSAAFSVLLWRGHTWVCHAVVLSLPHSTVRTAGTCQAGPTGPASAAPRQVGEAVTEALVEQAIDPGQGPADD